MKPHYIVITNDLFDIAARLKSIDSAYVIYYNTFKSCYEVHNLNQADSYCISIPYSNLDSRTVELVYKTRSQRMKQLIEEMEVHNKKLEQDMLNNSINKNIEYAINAAN